MPVKKPAGGQPEARILPTYSFDDATAAAIADKDGNLIIVVPNILDYQWQNRHVTLVARAQSKADLETIEGKSRLTIGGSVVVPITGGQEIFQDLTSGQLNILFIVFNADRVAASNLKNGYYGWRGFEMIGNLSQRRFLFSMQLFWIGDRLS